MVGWQEWLLDDEKFAQMHSHIHLHKSMSFFDSLVELDRNLAIEELRSLNQTHDRKDVKIMFPTNVNAYYYLRRNLIVFPAAILQPPLFSNELPDALNFGGIGSAIGHELLHAFDESGRNFDGNGILSSWMSSWSAARYSEIVSCLMQAYEKIMFNNLQLNISESNEDRNIKHQGIESKFSEPQYKNIQRFNPLRKKTSPDSKNISFQPQLSMDLLESGIVLEEIQKLRSQPETILDTTAVQRLLLKYTSKRLQRENVADTVGLELAFRAFKEIQQVERLPYPMNRYTPDQLFFISFAQLWCSNSTSKKADFFMPYESHSSEMLRVLGSTHNLVDFRKAFNCSTSQIESVCELL